MKIEKDKLNYDYIIVDSVEEKYNDMSSQFGVGDKKRFRANFNEWWFWEAGLGNRQYNQFNNLEDAVSWCGKLEKELSGSEA